MTTEIKSDNHGSADGKLVHPYGAAPKWAALVNDILIPMPTRHVRVAVLREQASVEHGHVLYRDHNNDNDPVLLDNGTVDLAAGNVFYSSPECEIRATLSCEAPPKLGFMLDDKWVVVVKAEQTGRSIRDLFDLSEEIEILRDLESPDDVLIDNASAVNFADGCVFRTRRHHATLQITVNKLHFNEKNGVKPKMKGREIAALVEEQTDQTKVQRITAEGPIAVGLDETIPVANCDEFKVIRCNVNAGFQSDRIERELTTLRERGARITFILGPVAAVIYHDMPVKHGLPLAATDVLVKVPSGYPGGIIDNAFLPEGSPLLSRTVGAEQQVESIGGLKWKQKSIHPHTGNGIPWDKDKHGFHTYYTEMVSWLNA